MTRENLYTAGNEFMLPDGEVYVGSYHVHVSLGAMVGRSHSSEPHHRLTPMTDAVAQMVASIQSQLSARTSQASSPPRSSASSY